MLFSCKFVNGKDQKLKNKDGILASIITNHLMEQLNTF